MAEDSNTLQVSAEDARNLMVLYRELRGLPGTTVSAESEPTGPGEQGSAIELLTIGLSSGAVTAMVELLRTLVESRGPAFKLTLHQGKQKLEVRADTIDEVEPLLHQLFDGS